MLIKEKYSVTILFSGDEVQQSFCFIRKPLDSVNSPRYSTKFNVLKSGKYRRFK